MNQLVSRRSPQRFAIRRLGAADAAEYRDLRLDGLSRHPEAFGASWEDEAAKPLGWFADRLERNAVFAGGIDGAPLAGTAGFFVQDAPKSRHKGVLWGMFVRQEARGTGLAAGLVAQVIDHARDHVEEIRLTVVASNMAARRLYQAAGFQEYGLEPRAMKIDGTYHDELLMTLPLDEPRLAGHTPNGKTAP